MDSSNAEDSVVSVSMEEDVEELRLQASVPEVEKLALEMIHSSMVEWDGCGNSSVHREVSFDVSAINASDANVIDLCAVEEEEENHIEISLNSHYTEKTLDTKCMSMMLAALQDSRELSKSLTNTSLDLERPGVEQGHGQGQGQDQGTQLPAKKDQGSVVECARKKKASKCCLKVPAKIIAGKEVNEDTASRNAATSPLFIVSAAEICSPTSYEDFVPISKFELYMRRFS